MAARANNLNGRDWLLNSFSVWRDLPRDGERKSHPAAFPVALAGKILDCYAQGPDDVVLDPFAGSGSTLLAAARAGKAVRGASILILGVAYKKNIDDMRESPALKIIDALRDQGANIAYHDPHVPRLNKLRDYRFDLQSQPLTADLLANSDLVILCTNHDRLDYPLIAKHSPRIIDTRGVLRGMGKNSPDRMKI